ncbi:hypothetical protein ABZ297_22100 [Nonomuraea sp. NPDC005983]|uniref:hypothetical protein n=1 Tax=Nonomuraea sp. NPDC005983 TaxID=3155595 RepID=UPI0033B49146
MDQYGWPPFPVPEPASPYEIEIERDRLREIRSGLADAAAPLDDALAALVGLTVAESAFTSFTYSLALAYNEVEACTAQELRHKAEDTVQVHDGLGASLATWVAAEHASTLRTA